MTLISEALHAEDYIQEGANPAPGVLLLACTIGEDYDNPKNRVLVLKGDAKWDFGVSGDAVVSIDADEEGHGYVLCETGAVIRFDWRTAASQAELKASRRLLPNATAMSLGPLRRIRVVGDSVLCGGSRGQLYQVDAAGFTPLPRLLVDDEDITIEDLCGTSLGDLLVVSTDGYVCHFDGSEWQQMDIPSNAGLNGICRLADGRYAIAGYNSTVLVGLDDQWNLVAPIEEARNYYGVASLGETVFVAYLGGIDVLDGSQLRPLEIPDESPLEFAVLRSGPDGVCSFAGHTVGMITPAGWRTMP